MSGQDDVDESRRKFKTPYTGRNPIPTISKYQAEKNEREAKARSEGANDDDDKGEPSKSQQYKEAARDWWKGDENEPMQGNGDNAGTGSDKQREGDEDNDDDDDDTEDYKDEEPTVDTSEIDPFSSDPKKRRKQQKKHKDERAERKVTDPVTHLPVTIHDFTSDALKDISENDPAFGTTPRTATGLSNKEKSPKQLQKEYHENEEAHQSMQSLYPPPEYNAIKSEIASINNLGVTVGLVGTAVILAVAFGLERLLLARHQQQPWYLRTAVWLVLSLATAGAVGALIVGIRKWQTKRIDAVWDDEVWEANRKSSHREAKAHETESVTWLNSLLSAVWPLINPDLFTSLSDTLEDVMQASLPKIVQMVSVDDVGQGSESIRILGIKWLPTGAAARSVASNGKLKSAQENKHANDRSVPGEGEVDDTVEDKDNQQKDDKQKSDDGTDNAVAEGMEAEEGNFINLEVAFAYRARASRKKFKDRMKDMHLYLAFYLPGKLKVPVWVDVRGVIGIVRLRLQLAPDPPFFALCTLTFLGQPKVDISCIPLVKKGPNIMDLPLISNFVQSSVDAAMSQYVAPKSLTLDLKDMLAGDDFKKDTSARGVLVVHIERGFDFKTADPGIPLIKAASADPYVSVGWAKFGKPMWSTRVLMNEMEPCWRETAYLLVTPAELNVDERLRVQLWDSDRFNADDDLGRIEVDIKQLMKDEQSNGKMCNRTDGFRALKAGEDMPGKLEWSVGYFSKTRIQPCQFERQSFDPEVRSRDQLEKKVDEVCKHKLREAFVKGRANEDDNGELEQQKAQELKSREDAMIISAPPPEGFPSGVFSIVIHQITGLELEKHNKDKNDDGQEANDEDEEGEELPSAYCNIILNHTKVFKTRTKPKNAKPFYNAGVERYIPDWRNAEIYVAVRDARVKEDDPLLGIIHLPLGDVFKERSQINGFYPLMGGVGYGRVRISMVWKSVQYQPPPQDLGWNYGTLEVHPGVVACDLPQDLQQTRIKFHSDLGVGKMYPSNDGGQWTTSKQKSLKLPVRKRYSSCLGLQFRVHGVQGIMKDKNAAYGVFWLRKIPDEDEQEVTIPVWKGDKKEYERAIANCVDDCGEQIGSVKLKLTFWEGLGAAHSKWASKEPHMREVVEVLDTARDCYESQETAKQAGIVSEESSDDDDDDSSEDEEDEKPQDDRQREVARPKQDASHERDGEEAPEEGKTGKSKQNIFESALDYKKHMKSEHRRQRGIMQWKIPRTAQFGVHKAEATMSKVKDVFRHHSREPGIETEV